MGRWLALIAFALAGGCQKESPGPVPTASASDYMSGAGEQMTLIVPSHDGVVVCLGHDKGEKAARAGLKQALAGLLAAVPRSELAR